MSLWVTLAVRMFLFSFFFYLLICISHLYLFIQSQHSATIDKPPDSILGRLGEKSSRQRSEARCGAAVVPATPAPPTTPTVDPIQQMVLMMGAMTPLMATMLHGRE